MISRLFVFGIGNIRGLEENKKNELFIEELSRMFLFIEIESKSKKKF